MNKKLILYIFFSTIALLNFDIKCKSSKSTDVEKKERKIKKSKDKESQIQNFFDPTIDPEIKLENAFQNPSRLKVFIRELGISFMIKYYVVKNWLKKNLNKMFN